MSKLFVAICFCFALFSVVSSENFPGCSGEVNNNPTLYPEPKLVASTAHGKKYIIGEGSYALNLGVFNGTPREVGYAYGKLFKEEIKSTFDLMLDYVALQVREEIKKLPWYLHWLKYLPVKSVFKFALETEYIATFFFVPRRWEEELNGVAHGAGISPSFVKNMNLFPELIRAACSIVGTWGPATENQGLLQLRALDWDADAPMSKNPMISIYHFNQPGSQPFANFGWAGLIGSLAGFSDKVGIAEKVWLPFQKNITSEFGKPWMYVLRDVLQFATDLDSGIQILKESHRTWQIFVGLGSREDNQLRGIEYSAKVLNVYDDKNYTTPYPNAHPQMDGVVFFDKHVQPSNDPCLGSILKAGYGHITPDYLFRTGAGLHKTGDTLLAIYDFANQGVYIAYSEYGTGNPAYNRSMTYLDMTALFNIQV